MAPAFTSKTGVSNLSKIESIKVRVPPLNVYFYLVPPLKPELLTSTSVS